MIFIFLCFAMIALLSGWGFIGIVIVGVALVVFYIGIYLFASFLGNRYLKKQGKKLITRTRHVHHEYDSWYGKYPVDEKITEEVVVPIDYEE